MATATYDKIATQTLASAASSITFSSIAASWTDLRLVFVGTGSAAISGRITFNSDTASNYSYTYLYANGTTAASSASATNQTYLYLNSDSFSTTIPEFFTVDIFSYIGSTYKTSLLTKSQDTNGSGSTSRWVGLWRGTAAITNINIAASGGNFNTGTTATLYGIKAE
jgi:hypothetical protein